jgi:hypothetical protein
VWVSVVHDPRAPERRPITLTQIAGDLQRQHWRVKFSHDQSLFGLDAGGGHASRSDIKFILKSFDILVLGVLFEPEDWRHWHG